MPHLDFTQPPFDILTPAERLSLKKHTQVHYLAANEALPVEDFHYFFVVLKGHVQQTLNGEFVASYLGGNHSDQLNNNDWFDSRRRPKTADTELSSTHSNNIDELSADELSADELSTATYRYHAIEDTLLLQVDGSALNKVCAQNHLLRQLLSDNLSERLKALEQRRHSPNPSLGLASYTSQQEVQQIMLQPVTDVALLPVRMIDADSSLQQAARLMTDAGLKHVLVRPTSIAEQDTMTSTLGILTDNDICRAVSEEKNPTTTPCQHYANFNLHTIDSRDDIGEALLTMTRYRIHRLPVIDDMGKVAGILAQSDLLAHIGHHSQLISIQIEQADNLTSLHKAVDLIGRYIRAQHQNGVKIGIVSRMVQMLNAQVFTKLWQLIVPAEVMKNTCVIVMGSEGRGEQIMRTDQDNALIIKDGFSHPDLARFAETFNQHLATLGYPLCDGNMMMTNPMWRQPLQQFKAQISLWFKNTDPMHSIYISAILDGDYVCGDEQLLTELRAHLVIAHQLADPMFVRQFVRAALQFGDINQWWQKFVPLLGKTSSSDIDLKKAGIFPIVHGIRALALQHNILQVPSTKNRLKGLVQARVLTQERADTLGEALEFFMAQRLTVALVTEDKHARQVNPTTLSALERDALKECLAVVKSFKNQLLHHYRLEII